MVKVVSMVLPVAMCTLAFGAESKHQYAFTSPSAAVRALVSAVETYNYARLQNILGTEMVAVWSSEDPERDAIERARFLDGRWRTRLREEADDPNRMILYMGQTVSPFPAPLVRAERGWYFDSHAGALELANRRRIRNEAAAVELCQRYLEAQIEYFQRTSSYARRVRSAPGLKNGLYWSDDGEADESLIGPYLARAVFNESGNVAPKPFFGYYFKSLVAQGPEAPGGILDYRGSGELTRGFALIAWPAQYGASGVNSYLVNQRGEIYQKDLGIDTGTAAPKTEMFNPDQSWIKIPPSSE